MRQSARWLALGACAAAASWAVALDSSAAPPAQARAAGPPSGAAFAAVTARLFEDTCSACHNSIDPEGGFDVAQYSSVESLTARRDGWDRILAKLRSREMPPPGLPRPDAEIDELVRFLDAEFARADAAIPPDSGRVAVRRLNRTEYTNTIRDLLGVHFRADQSFPADDSGDGFDNIADVLTVSPLLMEKYLAAAEEIAERALGLAPPPKPVKKEYVLKADTLRRIGPGIVEARQHIEHAGDYELRVGLPGQRPPGSKPVTLRLWVDGKKREDVRVATEPSGVVFPPYSEVELRVPLAPGAHTLRLGFVADEFVKALPEAQLEDVKSNKWIGSVIVVGPLAADPAKQAGRPRLLPCDPESGPACVRRIVATLARRAYRRPLADAEIDELTAFVGLATADGRPAREGVALALQAMLVSPHFLFHVERDLYPADPSKIHRISDVELASRLSYFLWSSMPDDELLDAAVRGTLKSRAVLDAQIARMLRDPKASALARNFAGQWLEIRNLEQMKPDPDRFPAWGPELLDAMKVETERFFTHVLENNRPIGDFIDARYTFLNDVLATHYGISGVEGPEHRRVALTTPERGGVLSHGSVLAVSSYPTRTSVVIRGKYVLQNILGAPPPPPPPDVPALDEQAVSTSASLREQMELHRANAVCASCHSRMDPLGFALENYDAIGKWRTLDGGLPVDASGTLPSGESFASPAEMRQVLKGMLPEFAHCLTEKMLTYALGRGLRRYDKPTVRAIAKRVADSGYRFQTLVYEIAHSLPFQSRRAEGGAAELTARE